MFITCPFPVSLIVFFALSTKLGTAALAASAGGPCVKSFVASEKVEGSCSLELVFSSRFFGST